MRVRTILITLLVPGLLTHANAVLAKPAHRAAAPLQAAPAHSVARTARPAAGHAEAMIARSGSERHGAAPRAANGIAGTDLLKPVVRSTVGGGSTRSGGIDGGTVRRRY